MADEKKEKNLTEEHDQNEDQDLLKENSNEAKSGDWLKLMTY